MLASVGIGGAKVDTRLEKTNYLPGEALKGEVMIWGGSAPQRVEDIYLDLMTHYKHDDLYVEQSLVHYRLAQRFDLGANETRSIPFTVQLPWQTPATIGRFPVWVRTGLEVSGLDPKDRDPINIDLLPIQGEVLRAIEMLGFALYKVDCEYTTKLGGMFPFVQEFEFKPMTSRGAFHIEELEVMFKADPQGVDVLLTVDRRGRGLNALFDDMGMYRDKQRRLRFDNATATGPAIQKAISNAISGALV